MKNDAALLGDDFELWDEGFSGTVDLFILVADDDRNVADSAANHITMQILGFATLLVKQKGNVLKMSNGTGIEHFGYADGISQPLYLKNEISAQATSLEWNDQTNLSLLLVPEAEDTDNFGSFFVFRKLEQNVKGFKDAEGDKGNPLKVLPDVKDKSGTVNKALAGAMLVGRFENGVPVVKNSFGTTSNPPQITNDFDYRKDLPGLKCPFHSHIRLMNPRNGDTIAGNVDDHRISRRGMPYDDIGRFKDEEITNLTEELLDKMPPIKDVGLLFMCYQSNIDNQFLILQAFWANKGQIGPHSIGAQDSIISQGSNPPKTFPEKWDDLKQSQPFVFPQFVTNKGGEYFFTPSITFLRSIVEL